MNSTPAVSPAPASRGAILKFEDTLFAACVAAERGLPVPEEIRREIMSQFGRCPVAYQGAACRGVAQLLNNFPRRAA